LHRLYTQKPDQNVKDVYLAKVPIQQAVLTSFMRYLREERSADIVVPKVKDCDAQKAQINADWCRTC
jgi:hypothetical protein